MSLIKNGKCDKCGKDFYWSIGHPDWFDGPIHPFAWKPESSLTEEEKLILNEHREKENMMRHRWFGHGNLCSNCHPSVPVIDSEIKISVTFD